MQLMRIDRPIGIYLLMWPTIWTLFLTAGGIPQLPILLIFILGVVIMRSAGCVINDFADRHVDAHVERTANRPFAQNRVSEKEALVLFALLIAIAFALVLMLNWQTVLLSIGGLVLASCYPFMKRYTHFPQVVLGAAYGWSIPMVSMATTQSIPAWVWLLFIANLCWTIAYDTLYAMVDRDDDLKIGVKSTAIAFGKYDLLIISLLKGIALGLIAVVFTINQLHHWAYLGLGFAATGCAFILWRARRREKEALFNGFLNNHYIGAIIGLSVFIGLL